MTYIPKTKIQFTQDGTLDAFYRQRISSPHTLFDSKLVFDSGSIFWDISGSDGGSYVYEPSGSSVKLTVTSTPNSYAVRQTHEYFNYQPGKSQLVVMTGIMAPEDGYVKRTGYFDENNGLFFEASGSVMYVVKRYNGIDTKVPQSQWNIDTVDGNGNSRINVDWTKSQIHIIDFEWLGVGRVRFGGFINGEPYYCHQFGHGNELNSVYMKTPNLPLRNEIRNINGATSAFIENICSSVMSEGPVHELGIIRYVSTAGTHIDMTTENVAYTALAIRLKDSFIGTTINIINTVIQITTANHKAEWFITFNPTFAVEPTWTDEPSSAVQIARGVTANTLVNEGIKIDGGFIESAGVQSGGAGSISSVIDNTLRLGKKIDGTRDIIVLAVRPVAGSSAIDVEASLQWRELL